MKETLTGAMGLVGLVMAIGNIGIVEMNPYPPFSSYLLAILGVVLMGASVFFLKVFRDDEE